MLAKNNIMYCSKHAMKNFKNDMEDDMLYK